LPQLGDYCIVDLVEGGGHLRRIAAAPEREKDAIALDMSPAFAVSGDSLVARVLRTGAPFVFSPSDASSGATIDLAAAHAWTKAPWKACLVVPLSARNRTVGAITLVSFTRGYGKDDLAVAQELGHRVALAVDNAHLYDEARAAVRVRDDVLGRVMSDAVDLLQPLADARGLTLAIDLGSVDHAYCDRERIVQVLSNLVGNAIKFTPSGGRIHVTAQPWGDMVRIAVSDDGPGIAPDQIPRIFDRYWHLAQRESRQGAGLGLYIAKGIVENHGGRIWVESTLGHGSTFYFTLPGVAAVMEAHASN